MRLSTLRRFMLSFTAAALLAACGGSQLPIGAPGAGAAEPSCTPSMVRP